MDKVFITNGCTNHTEAERQKDDFYTTPAYIVDELLRVEKFRGPVWECACGTGNISEALKKAGLSVFSSDIINRGYGDGVIDFFKDTGKWYGDIITNPPYNLAFDFVKRALAITPSYSKIAMFLKLTFLEGQKRVAFFQKYPPRTVYICARRVACYKDGDESKKLSSAICYAWFVWEKGYKGPPEIRWIYQSGGTNDEQRKA